MINSPHNPSWTLYLISTSWSCEFGGAHCVLKKKQCIAMGLLRDDGEKLKERTERSLGSQIFKVSKLRNTRYIIDPEEVLESRSPKSHRHTKFTVHPCHPPWTLIFEFYIMKPEFGDFCQKVTRRKKILKINIVNVLDIGILKRRFEDIENNLNVLGKVAKKIRKKCGR